MGGFTHFDKHGNAVMVDVTDKAVTERTAAAKGCIYVSREVFEAVRLGTAQKGDVLGTARIAGIMAAKKTSDLIPMCHPLMLTKVVIDFVMKDEESCIECICTAKLSGRTGVEMEALTGVSVALLTVYDMCKAMDRGMEIGEICLMEKSGGKSGTYVRGQTKRNDGKDKGTYEKKHSNDFDSSNGNDNDVCGVHIRRRDGACDSGGSLSDGRM